MEMYDHYEDKGGELRYTHIWNHGSIHMGSLMGAETALFIKTGQGGTIYGHEDVFLRLAARVRAKYGFSVFVSATESDKKEVFEAEMRRVKETIPDPHSPIYCFGYSKGGLLVCWYGADEPRVRRILTVNAPLMINFHNRTLPAMRRFTENFTARDKLTMVYGTRDPSYPYVPFLRKRAQAEILEGADHNLIGSALTFSDMVEQWLLYDVR